MNNAPVLPDIKAVACLLRDAYNTRIHELLTLRELAIYKTTQEEAIAMTAEQRRVIAKIEADPQAWKLIAGLAALRGETPERLTPLPAHLSTTS